MNDDLDFMSGTHWTDEQIAAMKATEKMRNAEIIDAMDTAIYDVSPTLHETYPKLAQAIFAAIAAYEKAREKNGGKNVEAK